MPNQLAKRDETTFVVEKNKALLPSVRKMENSGKLMLFFEEGSWNFRKILGREKRCF